MALQRAMSLGGPLTIETAYAEDPDKSYPMWTRMLIVVGGSALLWIAIGACAALFAQPNG